MNKLRLFFEVIGATTMVFVAVMLIRDPKFLDRLFNSPPPLVQLKEEESLRIKGLEDENRQLHNLVGAQKMLLERCGRISVVSNKEKL